MSRLRTRLDSSLVGKTVSEANLRHDYDIDLLKIMRPPKRTELQLIGQPRNGRIPIPRCNVPTSNLLDVDCFELRAKLSR